MVEVVELTDDALLGRICKRLRKTAVSVLGGYLLAEFTQLTLFPSGYPDWTTPSWEQRKLGNCGTTYGGLTGKTKEDFGHGNARFIPYTNVFDNPLTDTKRLGAVEIDSSQNQVAYGDAFFTVSSETPDEVGMSSVWLSDQEDVYLNSFCFGYRQDSTFDPHYLAYMLRSRSVRSNLTLLAQGISRFNISKNKVMELSVPVPSAVEQEQLGQYFTKLDSLITLHQRKCQYRGLYGYLSWEQRKFSDVAVIRRGLTYSPTNIVDGADGVRVLRSANINEDHFVLNDDDVFVDEGAVNIDLVHDGDILITAANGSPRLVGKRARISDLPGKTVHGGFMLVASSPYSDFLCASMGSSWYRRFLATGVAGGNGAIGNLDSKALGETTIAVPNDAEIDKLGNFFTRLDSLITLHQ